MYKARCNNKYFAIKKINLEFLSNRDYKLAMGETQKLHSLQSEFIIALRDFTEKNSIFYIVMDYAEGGDLATLIEKQKERTEAFDESILWKYFF